MSDLEEKLNEVREKLLDRPSNSSLTKNKESGVSDGFGLTFIFGRSRWPEEEIYLYRDTNDLCTGEELLADEFEF